MRSRFRIIAGTFRQHDHEVYRDGTASVTLTDGESDGSTVTVDEVTFNLIAGFVVIYGGANIRDLNCLCKGVLPPQSLQNQALEKIAETTQNILLRL